LSKRSVWLNALIDQSSSKKEEDFAPLSMNGRQKSRITKTGKKFHGDVKFSSLKKLTPGSMKPALALVDYIEYIDLQAWVVWYLI
jgi:hypothetical protein